MYVYRNFSFRNILKFSGGHLIGITLWVVAVTALYRFADRPWLHIPWLPISLIGTAVAFYVGFKNNSAYSRMWEARKIWGAIVNSSRAWGSAVRAFVGEGGWEGPEAIDERKAVHRRLIFRHIAWLYALRSQLLEPTTWEHAEQSGFAGKKAADMQQRFGVGLIDDDVTRKALERFLPTNEYEALILASNTATQIIDRQAAELSALRERAWINDFRHIALQDLLHEFYDHQGKNERIKKFPLPRQYASTSMVFVKLFILLLPFGMASEFTAMGEMGDWGLLVSIPFTILVGWVFMMMELVGDYTENPFQGMGNDIPMLSLCRTIEIDLLEMLGETDIPEKIPEKNGILM